MRSAHRPALQIAMHTLNRGALPEGVRSPENPFRCIRAWENADNYPVGAGCEHYSCYAGFREEGAGDVANGLHKYVYSGRAYRALNEWRRSRSEKAEAEVVKWIDEMYLDGASNGDIVRLVFGGSGRAWGAWRYKTMVPSVQEEMKADKEDRW